MANRDLTELVGPTLRALGSADHLVVAALGRPIADLDGPVPDNVRVVDHVPFDRVLPHTDVFVTNGGFGATPRARPRRRCTPRRSDPVNTAQGGPASSVAYVVMFLVCLRSAYRWAGSPQLLRRPAPTAVALWLVVAVPSMLQFGWPAIFRALERRPDLIEHGQVWRLLTSVVVQDGGVVGTIFNLVTLACTLPVAVVLWRTPATLALVTGGALAFNLLATFAWHDAGGGNSAATFVVATSMLGLLAARRLVHTGPAAVPIVVAVGVVLLAAGDAHGVAVLGGLAAGCLAGRVITSPLPKRSATRAELPAEAR